MLLPLLLIFLLSAVVAILVFGNLPALRNSPVHGLYLQLARANTWTLHQVRTNERIYVVLRLLIPVFYVAVVLFCVFQFFKWVYPALDTGVLNSWAHTAYIAGSILFVARSTIKAIFTDPGTVTAANVDAACSRYRNNGLIFFGKWCSTCQREKPARSKHCSVCNRCVLLYDHHCIWINNCVGQDTFRWFMEFLVLNINMMAYGAYLCWRELAQHQRPDGWWRLIVATTEANRIAGMLLILASVISLITLLFTLLHVRYLYLGVTTNEAEKWGDIEHLVSLGVLYFIVEKEVYVEEAFYRLDDGGTEKVYIPLNDDGHTRYTNEDRNNFTFVKIALMETDLINIYDRGFVENVKERVFPH